MSAKRKADQDIDARPFRTISQDPVLRLKEEDGEACNIDTPTMAEALLVQE